METEKPTVALTSIEAIWLGLTASATALGLIGVGLARAGWFYPLPLIAGAVVAILVGWSTWRFLHPSAIPSPRRERLFLAILLPAALLLFSWPAEHFPMMGDSAIYPNTAIALVRNGGLVYHYEPLDGLSPEQKRLFYIPSDRQLASLQIHSYQGLLYGAFYVMDPSHNTIVSSRPPLVIAWMGMAGLVTGPKGMLYITPLFGAASLVTLYFLGRRLFDGGTGALAALWLLVSFPQLHFSRTPYAEVVGQFFVLSALYGWVACWQDRRPIFALLGVSTLTAAFAARLDAILVLPTLALFTLMLIVQRDRKNLAAVAATLAGAVGFTGYTINRPYVGATWELLRAGPLSLLDRLNWTTAGLGGIGGLLLLSLLVSILRKHNVAEKAWPFLRWTFSALIILGVGYALYVRPLTPEYIQTVKGWIPSHNEELLALTARYVSPVLVWTAAAGVVLLLWQRRVRWEQILFLGFTVPLGAIFFWRYTTAPVYPVALRRLVPEVLPGLSLLAASALRRLGKAPRWGWAAMAIAAILSVLLVSVSGAYWFHRGASGALETLDEMAAHLPPDSVVLFEPLQEGAITGWFAAPLWSLHQRRALLLNSPPLDEATLNKAICFWQKEGREVYVVSWREPSEWWPGQFHGQMMDTVGWDSSIVGQSRRFPPYIWRFNFTFSIYRWEGQCPSGWK